MKATLTTFYYSSTLPHLEYHSLACRPYLDGDAKQMKVFHRLVAATVSRSTQLVTSGGFNTSAHMLRGLPIFPGRLAHFIDFFFLKTSSNRASDVNNASRATLSLDIIWTVPCTAVKMTLARTGQSPPRALIINTFIT